MNKKMIFTITVIGLLLFSPTVFAAVSSVTTSLSTSRATTGTSITATATVTSTTSESGSVQLVCTPSGTSVSDPVGGQYQGVSLSTTPTSKTFTFTAGTANTYSCTGQSGGVTSTEQTIVFVNPSALTVSGSPSSKSVSASGETFSLSVTMQNSQSSAVTTSYSLSLPSGYSASGDSTSDTITVSGSSSTTLAWTVTTGSSSGTITFKVGDNSNAFSSSVTVPSTTTTTTTTDTGGTSGATTPGVKVTLQKGKATITVPSIAAGKSATIDITKTEDVAFRKIIISVANAVNNIQVTVNKLADKPATITQEISGKVYHYIQVDKNVSDAAVNQTIIRFEVNKTWITENNVNKSEISLLRYTDKWNKLQTSEITDDNKTVLYEAISPGLSVFAIGVETVAVAQPTVEQPATEEKKEEGTPPPATEQVKRNAWKIVVIVVAFVIVVAGAIILNKKGIIKLSKILPVKKKSNWEDLKEKYSRR